MKVTEKDWFFIGTRIKTAVVASLSICIVLLTNSPSSAETLINQTETGAPLAAVAAPAAPARFKLGVELGASWHDAESRMLYEDNQYEFKIKYALEPGLRLRYEFNSTVALEAGLNYDWYRCDITPELTYAKHSSAQGFRLSVGPCFTFDVVPDNAVRLSIHPTVDWQYLDFDLDLPVRSYKSGPGVGLAIGLTKGAFKVETGLSLSGHGPEHSLPGTWVAKDVDLDRAFVRATVYYFDLPF
jgi:hypothetical protein